MLSDSSSLEAKATKAGSPHRTPPRPHRRPSRCSTTAPPWRRRPRRPGAPIARLLGLTDGRLDALRQLLLGGEGHEGREPPSHASSASPTAVSMLSDSSSLEAKATKA